MMDLVVNIAILVLPILVSGFVLLFVRLSENGLKLLLSFSGAYLLSLTFLHLLPEIYSENQSGKIGVFIIIGFFLQLLLEYFSTGIEHGHVHLHKDDHDHGHSHKANLPFSLLIGLLIHSFLEGMPLGADISASNHDGILSFKKSLIVGITLHNIPISIAFISLMKHLKLTTGKTILYLILFASMAPLGMLSSEFLKYMGVSNFDIVMKIALGMVVGIFLHISTTIMFESSENHKYNFTKLSSILLGALTAYFIS